MSDITEQLREVRGALHVNELRQSGTQDGNLYARWGSTIAFSLIEIERLRAINAELIRIVMEDKEGDLDFVQFQVRELLAKAKETT